MRKQTLFEGTLVLTAAGLLARGLGAVYRIVLPRLVGAEVIGLFQMAFPIYNLFLLVSISGLPLAVSRLVAEEVALGHGRTARRIVRLALGVLSASGVGMALLLAGGARWLGEAVLGDAGAVGVIRAVAPSVAFLALISGWRGFFQGLHYMVPSGVSQVAEQLVRVAGTLVLALALRPRGVEAAAAGAAFGAVLGSVVGLGVLLWFRLRFRREIAERLTPGRAEPALSSEDILRRIYGLAAPVVMGALIVPLTQSFDAALVPRRLLDAGYSVDLARALYGQLSGMAMVLAYFPSSVLMGLSVTIVPVLAEACARRRVQQVWQRIRESLWLTIAVGLPATVGLIVLAEPICRLLFADPGAAAPLVAIAPATLLLALHGTTVGILQGVGRPEVPVRYLGWGALLKVAGTYLLTAYPPLALKGAAYATVLSFAVATGGNLLAIRRLTGYDFDWNFLVFRPALATGLMALMARTAYRALSAAGHFFLAEPLSALATVGSIGAAALVYVLALLLLYPKDLPLRPPNTWAKTRSR
ncbi:MAG TPA: polysaccharide biosynthesis protein [Firmicutes bacterium]|nr:polysaccharide biosynthesis protein [Bacillota bacterium]